MVGKPAFGAAWVETMFIHHPTHYGLANLLEPLAVGKAERRVGFNSPARYASFMCEHDVVLFESGLHDLGLPFTDQVSYGKSQLRQLCSGRTEAECSEALLRVIRHERWRLRPLESYRARLQELIGMWRRCRAKKPSFRAIFKLAPAPRARQRPAECAVAQWGFSTASAQHTAEANELARRLVEGAGFEVFDGFGVTLHALPRWFDDTRHGVRYMIHESEATSDLVTQLFLSQLCARPLAAG